FWPSPRPGVQTEGGCAGNRLHGARQARRKLGGSLSKCAEGGALRPVLTNQQESVRDRTMICAEVIDKIPSHASSQIVASSDGESLGGGVYFYVWASI